MSEGSWRSDRPAARGVGLAIIMGTSVSGKDVCLAEWQGS
jgi:hypothetical protein